MPKPKPVEKLTYEEAFEELTLLVKQLEEGDLPLEEALALFERGQELGVRCNQLLEHAELRLRELTPDGEGGFTEIDFTPGDSSD
ncbi:MAG: exodeoxyribonuclease VII small subunit [Anaerolineales bacterium]